MAAATVAAAVSILIFGLGYLTESRRVRRRRLDDEALSAAIAFLATSSKRRRQLGVLNSMSRRESLVGKDIFRLDAAPEDVGDALKRYALILDQYSEAEARVRFLLPASLHRDLSQINEGHSDLRGLIGMPPFQENADDLTKVMGTWTDRAVAKLRWRGVPGQPSLCTPGQRSSGRTCRRASAGLTCHEAHRSVVARCRRS